MKKILVIDDEQNIRQSIVKILEYEGYHPLEAENGRLGIQFAKEHLPDLIICDIFMPETNGYEVLVELRNDPLTATVPFIFLTAKTSQKDVRYGMKLGADDYLTKPFDTEDLIEAIESRLERESLPYQGF